MTAYSSIAKSTYLTVYDATPATGFVGFPRASSGEGGAAQLKTVEDIVAIGRNSFGTVNTYVRLCRFPTSAKVKAVELYTDIAAGTVDSGAGSAALVFS